MEVVIWQIKLHKRSGLVCGAMQQGIAHVGDKVTLREEGSFHEPIGDVAVFYGLTGKLPRMFDAYRAAGKKAVYVDLGYWGRRDGGRYGGYHKIAVNDRHPTGYFQKRRHDPSRVARFDLRIGAYRKAGKNILLAGMGEKAAGIEGFGNEEWERATITALRQHTGRPIIYRPKPSWPGARPIEGVGYSNPLDPIEAALADCHCLVTHHSNAAVDALVAGVPVFCLQGVAAPMGSQNFAEIETPRYPDGREQWLADIAWTQWTPREMQRGEPWRHLKDEGLIP